jgi:hypothetical protein
MNYFESDCDYFKFLSDIKNHGEFKPSRYGDVYEILYYRFYLTQQIPCLFNTDKHNINIYDLILDVLSGITGIDCNDLYDISINSNHRGYYSKSVKGIEYVINILKKDIYSRQAIIPFIEYADLFDRSKELSCINSLIFSVTNNKLNMIVNVRSWDIYNCFIGDVFNFCMIMQVIANELGLIIGDIVFDAVSAHIYVKDISNINSIRKIKLINASNKLKINDYFKALREIQCYKNYHVVDVDTNEISRFLANKILGYNVFDIEKLPPYLKEEVL